MPRYIGRHFNVEAYQFTGSSGLLPDVLRGMVEVRRMGEPALVEASDGVLPCRVGDWLIQGPDGRLDVLPPGAFDARYEAAFVLDEAAMGGVMATFVGGHDTPEHEQPAYVDWLGLRFVRHKPTPVTAVDAIERLRCNAHFEVTEPEPEAAEPPPPTTLKLKVRA